MFPLPNLSVLELRPDAADPFRQVGVCTRRILKGEKPPDLPLSGPDPVQAGDQSQAAPQVYVFADEVIE
jgi:hypothetical protein